MKTFPILNVQSFKLSLFCTAVRIDNHEVGEGKNPQFGFKGNENSKVMAIGTTKHFVLIFQIVADK